MSIVRIAASAVLCAFLTTAAHARTISITTSDSVTLSADLLGSGEHGVVLLHNHGGDRTGWGDLPESLSDNGLHVVSVDLRGHGASKGTDDPLKMMEDAKAAAAYLKKRGAKKVTIVGAKLGGNVALAAAADDAIDQVVMISPALNANGVKVSAALKGLGDKKLYMIAGDDDTLSKKAVNLIDDNIDTGSVTILESGGSGMALVNRAADLESMLIGWASEKPDANAEAASGVQTGGADNLETTGTKLGEKR